MSELGVWIALSSGAKTRATLWIWFQAPLYSGPALSAKYEYWTR